MNSKQLVFDKIKSQTKPGKWTFYRNSEKFLDNLYDMLCVNETENYVDSPEMTMTISSSIDVSPVTHHDFKVRYVKKSKRFILTSKKGGYAMILNPHKSVQNDGISSLKLEVVA